MELNLEYLRDDEAIQNFVKTLSEDQKKRFFDSLRPKYKIYPTSGKSYQVFSKKENKTKSYFIISTEENLSCSCHDFYYNEDLDGEIKKCKHLWRLWAEIYGDYIPPEDEDIYEWLLTKVEKELYDYISKEELNKNELQRKSQLKSIRNYLKSKGMKETEYMKVYRSWANYVQSSNE